MPRVQLVYDLEYYGRHFDARRTKDAHGDMGVLRGNIVSLTMPAGSTHFDHLTEFGRSSLRPFSIKFLSEKLKEQPFVRGHVYFGKLGRQIEGILLNYPYLRWWLEEDGLVVDEARSELGPLSDFDRIAGPLVIEHTKGQKLSASAVAAIAVKLDREGFQLKQNLQLAQWKPISDYNQKHSRVAIKTFVEAVGRPQFVRSVRRRLYLARDRYNKALRPAEPIFVEI
jgi:hypothetical protein